MFMLGPAMQRIYELLALAVALYFPLALLTWLVIDKFLATGDGMRQVVRRPPGQAGRGGVFPDRSRPNA